MPSSAALVQSARHLGGVGFAEAELGQELRERWFSPLRTRLPGTGLILPTTANVFPSRVCQSWWAWVEAGLPGLTAHGALASASDGFFELATEFFFKSVCICWEVMTSIEEIKFERSKGDRLFLFLGNSSILRCNLHAIRFSCSNPVVFSLFTDLYTYHDSPFSIIFITPAGNPCHQALASHPLTATNRGFTCSQLPTQTDTRRVALSVGLLSLSSTASRFICASVCQGFSPYCQILSHGAGRAPCVCPPSGKSIWVLSLDRSRRSL